MFRGALAPSPVPVGAPPTASSCSYTLPIEPLTRSAGNSPNTFPNLRPGDTHAEETSGSGGQAGGFADGDALIGGTDSRHFHRL